MAFKELNGFVNGIIKDFGRNFAITLAMTYIAVKGFCFQLISSAALPFYKGLGVSGERYQSYGTIYFIPWSMKTSIGLFADTVPILGYHKRSYIVIASVFGGFALAALGLLPLSTAAFAPLATLLLVAAHAQIAVVDLLTEGKYAELMVQKPHTGSNLVSYVWGLDGIGTAIASLVVGPMADRMNARYLFLIALPLAVQVMLPSVWGWFPEERIPNAKLRTDKLTAHPNLLKLAIAMTIGPILVAASAFGSSTMQSTTSTVVSICLAVLGFVWLPDPLRRANLFLFLMGVLYVALPGALDFFYTADAACVPNGPNFSMTYYITVANIVASVSQFLGVITFQRFLSYGTFRQTFILTTILKIFASFFDIVIVKRYNLILGIPDKILYLFGDAFLSQVIVMLELMPCLVFTSKVCPPGLEASVYSLLASYQNLGTDIARALGVGLISWCGIKTVPPCDFSGLPLAMLIGHVALPSLAIPLVYMLLPDARMTDDIIGTMSLTEENASQQPRAGEDDSSDTPLLTAGPSQ